MSSQLGSTYSGRKVLVTGHTGFKGGWLSSWLHLLGANVHGLALAPDTAPSLFEASGVSDLVTSTISDVRDASSVSEAVKAFEPEIVFHLAAQPLVRESYRDPIGTFATNVVGTAAVFEACRQSSSVKAVVCVTTDKVYLNLEENRPFNEGDRLGGLDPYSASKACSELVALVYQRNFRRDDRLPLIATARGGNVVGGGDWCADRIVPDIVRALAVGRPLKLRNPAAVRPWQHVLELCEGYLELGARLFAGEDDIADAWNIGPAAESTLTVGELVELALSLWSVPDHPVEVEGAPLHEAQFLRLDTSKSLARLNWKPRLSVQETLAWTVEWYRNYYADPVRAQTMTFAQIGSFQKRMAQTS